MNSHWAPISGDLVYVPSHVNLKRTTNGHGGLQAVTEFITLDSPATMLVSHAASGFVEVVYKGTKWKIDKKSCYPVRENN